MAHYLVQSRFSASFMSGMMQSPPHDPERLRGVAEKLGGEIEGYWLAFGEYDVIFIVQMPDAQSMAAFSMAICASGAVTSIKTTALLSWAEGAGALRRADEVRFNHPGSASSPAPGRT